MTASRTIIFALFSALLAGVTAAHAHVTLETPQAVAGSYYKAVIRVPHGCEGTATTAVRVRIADGVTGVKPQAKPGWKLAIVKGPLETPFTDAHGKRVTEGVREIVWSGGNLPDEHYEEFIMQTKLPATPNTTLHFPVVQECVKGVHRWIEIPAAGKSAADTKQPAPALRLIAEPK